MTPESREQKQEEIEGHLPGSEGQSPKSMEQGGEQRVDESREQTAETRELGAEQKAERKRRREWSTLVTESAERKAES